MPKIADLTSKNFPDSRIYYFTCGRLHSRFQCRHSMVLPKTYVSRCLLTMEFDLNLNKSGQSYFVAYHDCFKAQSFTSKTSSPGRFSLVLEVGPTPPHLESQGKAHWGRGCYEQNVMGTVCIMTLWVYVTEQICNQLRSQGLKIQKLEIIGFISASRTPLNKNSSIRPCDNCICHVLFIEDIRAAYSQEPVTLRSQLYRKSSIKTPLSNRPPSLISPPFQRGRKLISSPSLLTPSPPP